MTKKILTGGFVVTLVISGLLVAADGGAISEDEKSVVLMNIQPRP